MDVLVLAPQGLDQLWRRCADVISLGAAHQDGAGDLGGVVFQRVFSEGQHAVQGVGHAVNELAPAKSSPGRWLIGQRFQGPA